MDRLAQTLATLPSVVKNKDYFQKFFNNPEMKMTGKDFTKEILKLTDEPITRGENGESLGYGKIIAALEVPQNQPMIAKEGGHEGFPMDYRSDAGGGKTTPAVMSVFEVPRRIIDMVNPAHGKDVSTHYIAKSGKLRSTSELLMNTTSTFGEGVVRESSHEMRKDTLNKATTKEKTLAGEPKFKVSDEEAKIDLKPFEGNFKVNDSIKQGVKALGSLIEKESDKSNLSPSIKTAMQVLREAVRKQDATDEVLVPELRESYDAIVRSVENELANPALTSPEVLKEIQKTLKPLDKKIEKNSQRIKKNAMKAHEADMAEGSDIESEANAQRQGEYRQSQNEGADLEAEATQQAQATQRRDMAEGADLESQQSQQSDLEVGADVEAASIPPVTAKYKQFPYPAPATPTIPKPPVAPARPVPTPARQAVPSAYATPFPKNTPQSKPMGKLEGWRGWSLENGLNGGFWKNAVGWTIIVQGDKFKVYNPQKSMLGIYTDLEQAKRRVQRAEPKQ